MDILLSILKVLSAIIGFSILVFIHELGHFIMAIIFKIKVEKFSIGMGPAIYGFQKGDTFYQIGAIPFGGFCKFKGEELTDDIEKARDPDSFYGAKPYKRLLVALFGPLMNYLVAIIFLSILAMGSFTRNYAPNKIILVNDLGVNEESSPAKNGGLLTGDTIIKIDNKKIKTFQDITKQITIPSLPDFFRSVFLNKKDPIKISVLRNGEILTKIIQPKWDPTGLKYKIGIAPYVEPIIVNSGASKLHQELGLKDNDIIIGIDDDYSNICTIKIDKFLADNFSSEKKSVFHVKRENSIIDIPIIFNEINHKVSKEEFGFYFKYPEEKIKGDNFFKAFVTGFNESNEIIKMSMVGLFYLIVKPKKNVTNQLGGPVMIGYYIGELTIGGFQESIYMGLRSFFSTISYISLALAFFNLLPIPALDGGHIVFNFIEMITRKRLKLKFIYIINTIFFMLLMGLAVLILFFDVSKLINMGK